MLRCKNCKHPASTSSMNCTSCGQSFASPSGCLAAIGVVVVVSLLLFLLLFFNRDQINPTDFSYSVFMIIGMMIFAAPFLAGLVAYVVVGVKSQDRQIEDV